MQRIDQIYDLLERLAAKFPAAKLNESNVEAYANHFRDKKISLELLEKAFDQAGVKCKFFPSIAELTEFLNVLNPYVEPPKQLIRDGDVGADEGIKIMTAKLRAMGLLPEGDSLDNGKLLPFAAKQIAREIPAEHVNKQKNEEDDWFNHG